MEYVPEFLHENYFYDYVLCIIFMIMQHYSEKIFGIWNSDYHYYHYYTYLLR